jgi:hypothetical protein
MLAGCQTPNTTIKPPLHEQYIVPPSDDARFSSPPAYPKDTLDINQFNKKQPAKPNEQFQGPGGRVGPSQSGMSGY